VVLHLAVQYATALGVTRWRAGPGGIAGWVLAIVEQPMILVLSTTQATSLVSTTRHPVEQEIKRGNLTGHFWVIDDAEAE
jgi:hypothetical protein